jgi:hypothetical protein
VLSIVEVIRLVPGDGVPPIELKASWLGSWRRPTGPARQAAFVACEPSSALRFDCNISPRLPTGFTLADEGPVLAQGFRSAIDCFLAHHYPSSCRGIGGCPPEAVAGALAK